MLDLRQNQRVQLRFLLGPAGSGKTFRCLTEIRQALAGRPDGAPLLLLAPKQTTYQLERQLLTVFGLPGYTRLHILSFERLAHFILERLQKAPPRLLDEEGRVMVLRSLLTRSREGLKVFRASARLTGFAQQLSAVLSEFQRHELTPEGLRQAAAQCEKAGALNLKLQDLAGLLDQYLQWLEVHGLQDVDCLLPAVTQILRALCPGKDEFHLVPIVPSAVGNPAAARGPSETRPFDEKIGKQATPVPANALNLEELWVDGFADFSEQELSLLEVLLPFARRATLTFCLDRAPEREISWLSSWSVPRKSLQTCRARLQGLARTGLELEIIPRDRQTSRFAAAPALQQLETHWDEPGPSSPVAAQPAVRVAVCVDPEAEVTFTAREVLRFVRRGHRYREVMVLVRSLETYHALFQRVFSRYEIPFFLDRRESVAHHPLAELTRSALRTVALNWRTTDWFAALKSGLVQVREVDVDYLENEALARGWEGQVWHQPITVSGDADLTTWARKMQRQVMAPFQELALAMAQCQNRPSGSQLAGALRRLWEALRADEQLQEWASEEGLHHDFPVAGSVHATVWDQMNRWLANLELAFEKEELPLREWLPILEAGLSNLSVGLIPPALDQVLISAVDRSRNPDVQLALVLGLNEQVFPARPRNPLLLTDRDRTELERRNLLPATSWRQQLGRERYLAYIACTRARQQLILTCATRDSRGSALNPSPFLSQVRKIFPGLATEAVPETVDWRDAEHPVELIGPVLQSLGSSVSQPSAHATLSAASSAPDGDAPGGSYTPPGSQAARPLEPFVPPDMLESLGLVALLERIRTFQEISQHRRLDPDLAQRLYGPVLHTSVSRLEAFAACPFKFFIHSGLHAEERQLFELDVREQGSFQHEVLALFHRQLCSEGKRWRDISPAEARKRIAAIAAALVMEFRGGLLQATQRSRFLGLVMSESLQDFAETLVGWMHCQYRFDPHEVELPFGEGDHCPAWPVDLGEGHRLELYGRIDRVDLCRPKPGEPVLCVVIDYKSSQKQLDPVLIAHGIQLQLLAYLAVLRRWPDPHRFFSTDKVLPAGVFYVNLRGQDSAESNRTDALAEPEQTRKLAYRHTGRFDIRALPFLDARPDATAGDQFNYRRTASGKLHANCREPMPGDKFAALLDAVEDNLRKMGRQIYAGSAAVAPFRKGSLTACAHCTYQPICRVDPWVQQFRFLSPTQP